MPPLILNYSHVESTIELGLGNKVNRESKPEYDFDP